MPGDTELLRRYVRESSQEAFTEVVRRHVDFVYATALRQTGSPVRAGEVTQAVFIDLARKAQRLTDRDALAGWLHTSARYAAASLRRSEARRQAREEAAHVIEELARESDASVDWPRLRPILDEALGELRPRDREAVLLRFFKQRTFGEVGASLGLTEEAARKRVSRGVEQLRRVLARRGVTSTIAALELAMASQAAVAAPAGLAATVAVAASAAGAASLTLGALVSAAVGIAAIVVLAAAGTFAAREHVSANQAQEEFTAAEARYATLVARRDRLLADVVATRREQLAVLERVEVAKDRVRRALAGKTKDVSPDDYIALLLKLLHDPEWERFGVDLMENLAGGNMLRRAVGISDEQAARLRELWAIRAPWIPKLEIVDFGDGHGSLNLSLEASEEQDHEAIRRVLGEDAFRRYERFNETRYLRMAVVDKLASNLVYTDHPLTARQGEQLVGLLRENPGEGIFGVDWEKALRSARDVLAQEQIAALARLSGLLSTSWTIHER
jgi:RNA polymerase sigma factor (sigma-70 family)